jgi:hypothetical protein
MHALCPYLRSKGQKIIIGKKKKKKKKKKKPQVLKMV